MKTVKFTDTKSLCYIRILWKVQAYGQNLIKFVLPKFCLSLISRRIPLPCKGVWSENRKSSHPSFWKIMIALFKNAVITIINFILNNLFGKCGGKFAYASPDATPMMLRGAYVVTVIHKWLPKVPRNMGSDRSDIMGNLWENPYTWI